VEPNHAGLSKNVWGSSLLWAVRSLCLKVYRRFGTACRSRLEGMGLIGCHETWLNNCQYMPRCIPAELGTQLHRYGSLLSRNRVWNLA
jgi:hypothetical protein